MEKKKTNCGIYLIINLKSNEITGDYKVYAGSSENLKSRKYRHFRLLKNGRHENNYLQNAYNKVKKEYGEENVVNYFKFEIIKYVEKIEDKGELKKILLKEENLELNKYKDEDGNLNRNKCYNICPKSGSRLGSKQSEETKEKCRLNSLGNKYNLGRECKKETKKILSEKMKDRIISKEWRLKISESIKGHVVTEETKKKIGKKVINTTTGDIFDTAKEAATFYGISHSHIGCVCKGKRKTAGGYKWKYYNEVEIICLK